MDKIAGITILIGIIAGIISTVVVVIDYHKQWKLIEKEIKERK